MRRTKILSFLIVFALMLSLVVGCSNDTGSDTIPPESSADNYEEGTSDADKIVETSAAEKVLLIVSFGTSFNESRSLTIGGIEAAMKEAYPDYQVRRAFSSQIIIDKLAEREGLNIDNVTEAMDRLVLDGVKEVVVQPTMVMNGYEYDDVIAEVTPYADKFESLKIGKWLLADDKDYDEVAELIVKETQQFRADDTAIVFMGHGTEHESRETYSNLQKILKDKGYNDYIIGTVEHGIEIEQVQQFLSEMEVKKVVLRPFMIVAGDHANNDMAGDDEDSWKTILTEDGYEVETVLEGLGQIKGIQDIFIEHVKEAIDSPSISAAPAAPAAGVLANRIKDGIYPIEVSSSTSMFKIVDCQLTVKDSSMSAVMTLSGQGFSKVYMGTGEQALNDDVSKFIDFVDNGDRHAFTVPVEALDRDLDCAGMSAKKGTWYDHIIVFKSTGIPNEAFETCEIDVNLTGGSGRASIESPANLTYKGGEDYARIIWSSPNYIYMLIDDIKYLPVNTDGNSAFEIPITIDTDMKVTACTVAMSEPKEIEYVLHFDSSTIK
ncbi:MAG: cobalt chelatase [Clostridiales bacterium]|nr:cobalt chelatase [Clostridiales bacterium]